MKTILVRAIVLRLLLKLHGDWDTFAILENLQLSFDLDLGAFFRETKNLDDAQMYSFVKNDKMTSAQYSRILKWKEIKNFRKKPKHGVSWSEKFCQNTL